MHDTPDITVPVPSVTMNESISEQHHQRAVDDPDHDRGQQPDDARRDDRPAVLDVQDRDQHRR